MCRGEFKRLSGDLSRELLNGVVQVAEFCRRNEIDADLFRKLLPPVAGEGTWQWLGHDRTWVVGTAFYKAKERDIQKSLIDEKRSVCCVGFMWHAPQSTATSRS
jgi:hypothetical protein